MKLTEQQKSEQLGRLWEITETVYTGAQLPTREFFNQCVSSGDVFVEWAPGSRILGYALVNKNNRDDDPTPLLRSIAVVKAWRSHGIGSRLLTEIDGYYSAKECRSIILHCKTDNPAQTLYFRHGYRVTHVLHRYYQEEGDGLEMRRDL